MAPSSSAPASDVICPTVERSHNPAPFNHSKVELIAGYTLSASGELLCVAESFSQKNFRPFRAPCSYRV